MTAKSDSSASQESKTARWRTWHKTATRWTQKKGKISVRVRVRVFPPFRLHFAVSAERDKILYTSRIHVYAIYIVTRCLV